MADMQQALRRRAKEAAGALATQLDWGAVPEGTSRPYGTLLTVDDADKALLDGGADLGDALVQVDCYGDTYGAARALAKAIKAGITPAATVDGVRFERSFVDGPSDSREQGAAGLVHRCRLDVRVRYAAAA